MGDLNEHLHRLNAHLNDVTSGMPIPVGRFEDHAPHRRGLGRAGREVTAKRLDDSGRIPDDAVAPARKALRVTVGLTVCVVLLISIAWRATTPDQRTVDAGALTGSGSFATSTSSSPPPGSLFGRERPEGAPTTLEGGWIRYAGWTAAPEIPFPPSAWVAPSVLSPLNSVSVFDEPDGTLIGYHYSNIGFVPVEMVPTFDIGAASIRMWGCDMRDRACNNSLLELPPPTISPQQLPPR